MEHRRVVPGVMVLCPDPEDLGSSSHLFGACCQPWSVLRLRCDFIFQLSNLKCWDSAHSEA